MKFRERKNACFEEGSSNKRTVSMVTLCCALPAVIFISKPYDKLYIKILTLSWAAFHFLRKM
jgi:hypothetical protein